MVVKINPYLTHKFKNKKIITKTVCAKLSAFLSLFLKTPQNIGR